MIDHALDDVVLIAAVTNDRVIGQGLHMPWPRIPSDLPRFKQFTKGNAIIVGRTTLDSHGSLENRTNIALSRNPEIGQKYLGVHFVDSVEAGIELARSHHEIPYITGGGEIYRQAIERNLPTIYEITHLDMEVGEHPDNVYFPDIDFGKLRIVEEDHRHGGVHEKGRDAGRAYPDYSFVTYVRT